MLLSLRIDTMILYFLDRNGFPEILAKRGGIPLPNPVAVSDAINLPAVLVANGVGIMLMLILMFSGRKRVRAVSLDSKIFHWMCRLCMLLCALESLSFWVDGKQSLYARPFNIFINVVLYLLDTLFAYLWVCYVDYKLFEDTDRIRKYYVMWAIPAFAACFMSLINLFTPVFFGVTSENVYYRTPHYLVAYAVTYAYLTFGAIMVLRFRKRVEKYLFMPMVLFLVPVFLGSLIQFFYYGLALVWVSSAIGLTSLYVSLQNEESYLDSLTTLYNRSYLFHYMDYLAKQAEKGHKCTGIMLDINEFKYINDTFGHAEGDAVLQATGKLLLRAVNQQGIVARYGGDEFVILLIDATDLTIQAIQRDIQAGLDLFNASSGLSFQISMSIGLTQLRSLDVDGFFRAMDQNMYEKKRLFYEQKKQDDSCPAHRYLSEEGQASPDIGLGVRHS